MAASIARIIELNPKSPPPHPSQTTNTIQSIPSIHVLCVATCRRLSKGKKGLKKKIVDPFSRKEWYDLRAPTMFDTRVIGKTLVNRTQGTKNSVDFLKSRVVEASLGDLHNAEDQAFRKFKLRVDEVVGRNCLTSFHSMSITTDKLRSLVKKWQSMVEAHVDVKTTDGYLIRLFAIGFTKRRQNQVKKTTYAQTAQLRAIRKKMFEIMTRVASSSSMKELVLKFIPEAIGLEIEKECHSIYPLQNVYVHKCKVVKFPRVDNQKLMESHGSLEDTGSKIKSDFKEPEIQAEV